MGFYTQVNRPKTIPSESGRRMYEDYQERINKDTGEKELVEVGKHDIYKQIQAGAEDSKIINILKRVSMGDMSALMQKEATYVDATTMPKNLMEAQNLLIRAKNEFEQMPEEVRNLFNNNPEKYVSEMGTPEFLEKMAPYNKKIAEIAEAGNMKAYNKKVAEQAKFETDVAKAKETKAE